MVMETIIVRYEAEELYPVYIPNEDGYAYKVPKDLADRYGKAYLEFKEALAELRKHIWEDGTTEIK